MTGGLYLWGLGSLVLVLACIATIIGRPAANVALLLQMAACLYLAALWLK